MSDNKALLKNLEDTLLRELSNATGAHAPCEGVLVSSSFRLSRCSLLPT